MNGGLIAAGIAGIALGPFSWLEAGFILKKMKKLMKLKRRDNKCYKNSYKKIITKTSVKILDEYKNNYNNKKYELIKGKELINLIENIEEKIVTLNNTSFNILDLFEKYIYGLNLYILHVIRLLKHLKCLKIIKIY